jgi:hypothetical protein
MWVERTSENTLMQRIKNILSLVIKLQRCLLSVNGNVGKTEANKEKK